MTNRFLSDNDVEFNQDLYALSEMLQFIFRSRLRNGEEIHLLIASSRMRELFNDWLNKMHHAYHGIQEQIEGVISYQEKKRKKYLNTERLKKDSNFRLNRLEYELAKRELNSKSADKADN